MRSTTRKKVQVDVPDVDEDGWDTPFNMTPDRIADLTREMDKIDDVSRRERLELPLKKRLNILVTRTVWRDE